MALIDSILRVVSSAMLIPFHIHYSSFAVAISSRLAKFTALNVAFATTIVSTTMVTGGHMLVSE